MKKILFAIDYLSGGGAERVTSRLANYFADVFGYDVTVAVMFHVENTAYEYSEKIRILYIEDLMSEHHVRLARLLNKMWVIMQLVKRLKPDAFVSLAMPELNNYFMLACLVAGIKNTILSERNDPKHYPRSKVSRILRNVCYHMARRIVFQTKGAMNYFSKSISRKGCVIPNPVQENLPQPFAGERQKKVVTFGRLEPQKNLKLLVDAFEIFHKNHCDYQLVLYGSGVQKTELEEYAKSTKCSDCIHMFPFCKDVHQKINDAAMYVLSSDYEGISNSMLEALCMGIPTICTDCPPGGAREYIVDGQNGLLVPVGDKKCLAKAMETLATDKIMRDKISNNSTCIREKLDVSYIAGLWEKELWREV